MANHGKGSGWTDQELGFLEDHRNWSAAKVAQTLGRSVQSVHTKRHRMRHGWTPRLQHWEIEENEIILAAGPWATLAQLAERLPGRTEEAIGSQRRRLGVEPLNSNLKRPDVIGARPLLAKTCTRCGRLLQADWFVFIPGLRQWSPSCRKCRAARQMELSGAKSWDERARKSAEDSLGRQQLLTQSRATRAREPYTEDDHKVLADPDLTHLQKALMIGRSYAATRTACHRNGYKSHVGLGEPTDLWRIFNPNAPEQAA